MHTTWYHSLFYNAYSTYRSVEFQSRALSATEKKATLSSIALSDINVYTHIQNFKEEFKSIPKC